MSTLTQYLQKHQNQLIALETQKFQNLKIQENQERLIKDLKTSTGSTSQTRCLNSQPEILCLIKKSTLLFEQYEKLLVKNLIGANKYSLDKPSF